MQEYPTALLTLVVLVSAVMNAQPAEQSGGVELFVVPKRVYAASDGVAPQWRFLLAVFNGSDETLTLNRVVRVLDTPAGPIRISQSGDRIRGLSNHSRQAAKNQVLVLDIQGRISVDPPPRAVEVELTLTDNRGRALTASRRVALEPRPTLYLRFPLPGRWAIANARTEKHSLGRQFGFDLIAVEDMPVFDHSPQRQMELGEFASYGRPVFAPADGTIGVCVDGRPDFPPTPGAETGKASFIWAPADKPDEQSGNYAIIRTANGDYIHMAHFKPGSLLVKPGDRVREGQQIAEVGNSGATSQPHLHIEVLDGLPDFPKLGTQEFGQSGLPFGFKRVVLDHRRSKTLQQTAVPRRRDIVSDWGHQSADQPR